MKKKYFIILFFLFTMVCILFSFSFFLGKRISINEHYPTIQLKGKVSIRIPFGSTYYEKGVSAYDKKDGDISKNVAIIGKVDTEKLGVQQLTYEVTNSRGNKVTTKRFIHVDISDKIPYQKKYDEIDNKVLNWGTNNKKDGTRPSVNMTEAELKKVDAYAMGKDEKVIYLTFDEGSLETYLPKIVEVLDENKVKATFFLCYTYMKENKKLIKEMVENGHSIGNHTANHKAMMMLANKDHFKSFLNELILNEKLYKKITGKEMDPIYREPKGEFSMRTLNIMKDLGYHTYFWSAAYKDWDDKLTEEEALKAMLDRVHNGAIYLLHPTSRGNYLALSSFIKEMKRRGYSFDLVKNIV